ncbi:MAG: glycosyltransferase family 2 protein [Egibacteraceae bacterium]
MSPGTEGRRAPMNKQAATEAITVITVTRERPALLRRAIRSVLVQDYRGPTTHLVLVDGCPATISWLRSARPGPLSWMMVPRCPGQRSGPARLAKLRNLAVRLVKTRWMAFLDDDNEYEINHLSSLMACAQSSGSPAVHSQRTICWSDGQPYLEQRMPWKRDKQLGGLIYKDLCDKGVFTPGSNVVRDRADPKGHPGPARMVDTSEWLFRRRLLLEMPFSETYSLQDWMEVIPEDNKLLQRLVAEEIPIVGTGLPTLRYYLGGYSNAFEGGEATGGLWQPPEQAGPLIGTAALLAVARTLNRCCTDP